MKRWLFDILAAALMVICLAAAALWVRSYWVTDAISRIYAKQSAGGAMTYGSYMLGSESGGLIFARVRFNTIDPAAKNTFTRFTALDGQLTWEKQPARGQSSDWSMAIFGFVWNGEQTQSITKPFAHTASVIQARAPLGSIVVLTGVPPIIRLLRSRKRLARQRLAKGLCVTCGYDLRASKDKCPECGTAIPPRPSMEGANT